jgi:hypothetical protein
VDTNPTLGKDGAQTPLTTPTNLENQLETRAQQQRAIERTDALIDREENALNNRDIADGDDLGRAAAANRASRSFNDYRENSNANAGLDAQQLPATSNRWRYVRHNNQWWYWTPQNTWLIWSGDRWMSQPDFNRLYANDPIRGSYQTGYRGPSYQTGGYYDGTSYGRGYYYGPAGGPYNRGYFGRGFYGPGNYGYGPSYGGYYPGYYNQGAATGANIGGAIGGYRGAGVGAAIGGAINGF